MKFSIIPTKKRFVFAKTSHSSHIYYWEELNFLIFSQSECLGSIPTSDPICEIFDEDQFDQEFCFGLTQRNTELTFVMAAEVC